MRKSEWHVDSWSALVRETLPELLADRVAISQYTRTRTGKTVSLTVGVAGEDGDDIVVTYEGIPYPDADGIFIHRDQEVAVVVLADDETLERVSCGGEQALAYLEDRIPPAPERYFSDASALRAWLPLEELFDSFFMDHGQLIDGTNAVSRHTHVNRILIPRGSPITSDEQIGKACPIETPEGPNIGRVLTVARGATIVGGTIRANDDSSTAFLGLAASMIPFLEHTDAARSMMGANMMRQWIPPLEPDTPMVLTGNEPDDIPGLFAGHNLLTAYTSIGAETCEDALVLSESAVERMRYERPIEPGDKLSNRNGQKGVVSEIRADADMPCLPDGTPVEMVCSFVGLHTRMSTGQLLEAVAGRIAHASGERYVAVPFAGGHREQLQQALAEHELPADGMEHLTVAGKTLERASAVGWVYWGLTKHLSRDKLRVFIDPASDTPTEHTDERAPTLQFGQRLGTMEYWILRDAGCHHVITETIGARSASRPEAGDLARRVAAGEPIPHDSMPFSRFREAMKRAGISVEKTDSGVEFSWNTTGSCKLALPVKHPWWPEHQVETIESTDPGVVRENSRLKQLLESQAPDSLVDGAHERLTDAFARSLRNVFTDPSPWADCLATDRSLFAGRAVIIPGIELAIDQVAIPDDMAWPLFGPFIEDSVGRDAVEKRTDEAATALDALMEKRWVIINRAPSINETALIGFRPVRSPHQSIGLNPLVCRWLNADFDGDQVAIFVPIGDEAVSEVQTRLSVQAQIARDPSRAEALIPPHESMWGLSRHWMSDAGRAEILEIIGIELDSTQKYLRQDELMSGVRRCLEQYGADAALGRLQRLTDLGFATAHIGASMNPFAPCAGSSSDQRSRLVEQFESRTEFEDDPLGPQLLLTKAGIRGTVENLVQLACSRSSGSPGLLEGLSPDEIGSLAFEMREHINDFVVSVHSSGASHSSEHLSPATTVMARALRSERPGVVFASAAARGEIDPLTDRDARLWCGLIPVDES